MRSTRPRGKNLANGRQRLFRGCTWSPATLHREPWRGHPEPSANGRQVRLRRASAALRRVRNRRVSHPLPQPREGAAVPLVLHTDQMFHSKPLACTYIQYCEYIQQSRQIQEARSPRTNAARRFASRRFLRRPPRRSATGASGRKNPNPDGAPSCP
jgi:hypothetical protein